METISMIQESKTLQAIKAFDDLQCIWYLRDQLKKLDLIEISEGVFTKGDFKIAFSVGMHHEPVLPMIVIYPEGGKERIYPEFMNLYSIAHVRMAYTKLTGQPL